MTWRPGDIVRCKFLHLNTVNVTSYGPAGEFECTAKGKDRWVLVLNKSDVRASVDWYAVLKLTSKGGPDGKARRGFTRLGRVIDDNVDTFAEDVPHQFPGNLFSPEPVKSIGRLEVGAVLKIIAHKCSRTDGFVDG